MTTMTRTALSAHRQRLVELIRRVNFGRIEKLVIRDGEPVLDPPPVVIAEIKFAGENGPAPTPSHAGYLQKPQFRELFQLISDIRNGELFELTFKHGIPFSVKHKT